MIFGPDQHARIDGLTVMGASQGGGIVLNGFNPYTEVSNNRIINNQGFYHGGVRVGHPTVLEAMKKGDQGYTDAGNDYVRIHNNHITQNSGLGGSGGGIALHTGADSYEVRENFICGNFTMGEGGGIGHEGLSDGRSHSR